MECKVYPNFCQLFYHHQKSVYSHRYSYYVHAPGQYPECLVGSCYPCLHGYSRNTQPGDGNSEKYSIKYFPNHL